MRFAYLMFLFLIISNLIIYFTGNIMGVNLYKKYGKQIFKGFCKFLLFILFCFATTSTFSFLKSKNTAFQNTMLLGKYKVYFRFS